MKKSVILLLVICAILLWFIITLTIKNAELKQELYKDYNYSLVEVVARNDYYTLEEGTYYYYKFEDYNTEEEIITWFKETQLFSVGELVLVIEVSENEYQFIDLS